HLQRYYLPLTQALADDDGIAASYRGVLDDRLKEERRRLATRRDEELKRVDAHHAKMVADGEAQRDERLRKINEVYATRMVEVQTTQQRDLRDAIDAHDRRMAELRVEAQARSQK